MCVLYARLSCYMNSIMAHYQSDEDSFDITSPPPTPGKNLDLSAYTIPKIKPLPMETDQAGTSQPTPAQRQPSQKNEERITLSDKAKKMVWGELGKIKSIRTLASKCHFLGKDIMSARKQERILPAFTILKSLPQLPGGELSWAFQTEWESTLRECSEKLMDVTASYLLNEKVASFEKKASDLSETTLVDLKKAIPENERDKGVKLFSIVDQSMKRLKRVKSGKITKPKRQGKKTTKVNMTVKRQLKL